MPGTSADAGRRSRPPTARPAPATPSADQPRLSASFASRPLRIAVYLSEHGVGHAVRAGAVLDALSRRRPLRLTVVGGEQRRVWPAGLSACTAEWIRDPVDAGAVQSDDVTVDLAATGRRLDVWLASLEQRTAREAARLAGCFDLVVGDVPSPAFAAAKHSGIPSVAIANFSWDWIYAELGFAAAAEAAAAQYASASVLLRAAPFAPMPAFGSVVDVGLVARPRSAARREARSALGLGAGDDAVLLAFQAASAPSVELPPPRADLVWLAPHGWSGEPRPDLRSLPRDLRFEDAIAAADLVVGKPGYGLIGDVEAAGVRFLYVPRPGFPENAVLEAHLAGRPAMRRLDAAALAGGDWIDDVEALLAGPSRAPADASGAERAAATILDRFEVARSAV